MPSTNAGAVSHRRRVSSTSAVTAAVLTKQLRQPEIVSRSLLSLRGDAGANDPVFVSRKGGRLAERTVNDMVKRAAKAAGINEAVSPHWLRHAHGSHAIERGASLPRGSGNARPRQHLDDERLSARTAGQL